MTEFFYQIQVAASEQSNFKIKKISLFVGKKFLLHP